MATKDDDLLTVYEFAAQYRVDTSEVRRWIKTKAIPYELVGNRQMRRIRRSMVVQPVVPPSGEKEVEDGTRTEPGRNSGDALRNQREKQNARHAPSNKKK